MGVVLLKRKLTSFQIIILGFSGVILFGTFLLMLPFSSRSGLATPFSEALFTSTSAVCVTGLIIHDTATYWSAFGQFVILLLIQIGGMGVITVAASFAMISGRKISLMQRSTMQEAISAPKVGGIVRLTGFIVRVTLVMELLCAAVMAPVFCRDFGKIGLWMALFHSVSAFCNAGFDLLGVRTPFSSLTSYAANPVINFTIMFLIVFGGIGFLTWEDIRTNRLHLHKYRMQSKVILCTTAVLLIVPAMYFYFFEFADLTRKERILSSLFQAVTPRTAGFNTVDKKMDDALREQTFTDIYDDSMWLINLVENLLAVTRIEGGQVNLTRSIELMDEVVSEALKHINRKSKEHTIRVTSGKDFILAHIDAKLIVQVIINLVDNAIKYTPAGSVIEIHTEQKNKWVIVSVADNGPGIPDEQKPRVFDMFYSGANKVVDSRRSLGLGLSLCKSIVTAHGGTISVSDNQPNGTVFTFTLPAGEVELHE